MPESKDNIADVEGLRDYEGEVSGEYIEPSSIFPPWPIGVHTTVDLSCQFEATKRGQLCVILRTQGQSEKVSGLTFNFHRVYNSPYYQPPVGIRLTSEQRRERPPNTSSLLNWLKVKGYDGNLTTLPKLESDKGRASMQVLVESMLPIPYQIEMQWEGVCRECRDSRNPDAYYIPYPSYSKFPPDGAGGRKFVVNCDRCGEEIVARNRVVRYKEAGQDNPPF